MKNLLCNTNWCVLEQSNNFNKVFIYHKPLNKPLYKSIIMSITNKLKVTIFCVQSPTYFLACWVSKFTSCPFTIAYPLDGFIIPAKIAENEFEHF